MLMCTCFVFLSLVEFAFVNVIIRWTDGKEEVGESPPLLSKNSNDKEDRNKTTDGGSSHKDEGNGNGGGDGSGGDGGGGAVVVINSPSKRKRKALRMMTRRGQCRRLRIALGMDRLSRFVVPAAFVALNVVYWIVYG